MSAYELCDASWMNEAAPAFAGEAALSNTFTTNQVSSIICPNEIAKSRAIQTSSALLALIILHSFEP